MRVLRKLFGKPEPDDKQPYRLPAGQLVYAVGDIHGRFDLLLRLLERIEADRSARKDIDDCKLIFLGDYVDRGFQSKDVIEWLANADLSWADVITLRGNHEAMLLDFLRDPAANEAWLHYGGMAVLASYGVRLRENEIGDYDVLRAASELEDTMPLSHMAFLKGLPLSYRLGDYFFVHAGLRPGIELEHQDERDLMFIRQDYTDSGHDFGFRIVHGHTGVQNPVNERARVAVDTTAYATGRLTAAVLFVDQTEFITT